MCRVIFRSCYSLMPAANPSTTFVSSWRVFSSASTTCSGAFNEKEKCRRDSQAKRFSQTDREVYDSVGAIRHCVPFVRNPTSDQHWRRSSFLWKNSEKHVREACPKCPGLPVTCLEQRTFIQIRRSNHLPQKCQSLAHVQP